MSEEIEGIELGTSVDVELMANGFVEVFTDSPGVCCVSIVKLDKGGVDKLIAALQKVKELLK